ncbi:hypothetical protein GN956_G18927 [Arapaima gigas]
MGCTTSTDIKKQNAPKKAPAEPSERPTTPFSTEVVQDLTAINDKGEAEEPEVLAELEVERIQGSMAGAHKVQENPAHQLHDGVSDPNHIGENEF